MAVDRVALLLALESRLRAEMPTLVTISRHPKHWSDTPPEEQPACFIALGNQAPSYTTANAPAVWTINATVYLYARRVESDDSAPSLAKLLTELESALEWKSDDGPMQSFPMGPGVTGQTTLGGACHYARIAGDTVTDEGLLDDQQVGVVTVELKVGA